MPFSVAHPTADKETMEMPVDRFDNYEDDAPIEFLEVGEREEMLGGLPQNPVGISTLCA